MNRLIKRRLSRGVKIGKIAIGASNPVAVQSMSKTKTSSVAATVEQVNELAKCGCEIVRVAVKDEADALAIKKIKQKIKIPLVADIHFNWQLAIKAIECGADKIRLNPGNIFRIKEVSAIAAAAKMHRIPIRVGVNSGSVKNIRLKNSQVDNMASNALDYVKVLEKLGFYDIVISLKASNVTDTVACYRKIARACDYPLHLGVTATGAPFAGSIKSSIAIGTLLLEGIGDTIRVSLTDEPAKEVGVARVILEALQLRSFFPDIISCPTCGRCEVDLAQIVRKLEARLSRLDKVKLKTLPSVAVMGCEVNGPGEARQADIGIAFGKKDGLLFKKGKPVRKVSFSQSIHALLEEMGVRDV